MKQLFFLIFFILGFSQFSCSKGSSLSHAVYSDSVRVKKDMITITHTSSSRNYRNVGVLNYVAQYIYDELSQYCDTVCFQTFEVNGKEYKNVIGSIGIDNSERIIIGAHYDVAGDQEGADDNASGVCGILELSRLLAKEKLSNRIDFVAYCLEEPPFFRTENMGSNIHAASLYESNAKVKGMICLEMIGYFNDKPKSQDFPVGFLKLFYGNKGDFITVVQKTGNGQFGRRVKRLMKRQGLITTRAFTGPAKLQGIDFSDHQNYWKYGYSAVMITNTAFYRNKNYHQPTDKMETLDFARMCTVIDEVYLTLLQIE